MTKVCGLLGAEVARDGVTASAECDDGESEGAVMARVEAFLLSVN